MVSRWNEKVAIVTGASMGIGAAIARLGVAEGGTVWLFDVADEAGETLAAQLGSNARYRHVDVTDENAVASAVEEVLATSGRIDVLVNNASRDSNADARTMSSAEWDAIMSLDLKAPWLMSRAVLPSMVTAGSGSIVNIGSLHSRMTAEGAFPYGAAKAGVAGMTRSLALDFGPHGIRVNTVTPGYTASERVAEWFDEQSASERERIFNLHALRRIARPDEIAEIALFISSDAASFVTGADWTVDGGLSARYA